MRSFFVYQLYVNKVILRRKETFKEGTSSVGAPEDWGPGQVPQGGTAH